MKQILNIGKYCPELSIDKKLPRVSINQYKCFAEAGLKNNTDFGKEITRRSKGVFTESVARTVQEGDRLAKIGKSGPTRKVLAQIAREKSYSPVEVNVECIPKSRPQVKIEEGYLKIDWSVHGLVYDKKA